MISVSVFYPRDKGEKFDYDYYNNVHGKLVLDKLRDKQLLGFEVDLGLSDVDGNASPFYAVAHLHFESEEAFRKAFAEAGAEVVADIPNYTDVEPVIQISNHKSLL